MWGAGSGRSDLDMERDTIDLDMERATIASGRTALPTADRGLALSIELARTMTKRRVTALAFVYDGKRILTGGWTSAARVALTD